MEAKKKIDNSVYLFESKDNYIDGKTGYLWNGYEDHKNCKSLLSILENNSESPFLFAIKIIADIICFILYYLGLIVVGHVLIFMILS